jgi:hypothetical protein
MSHFYARIPVSDRVNAPTACGSKAGGIAVQAQTWLGRIVVDLSHDKETGLDNFIIGSYSNPEGYGGPEFIQYIAKGVVGQRIPSVLDAASIINDALIYLESASEPGTPAEGVLKRAKEFMGAFTNDKA